MVPAASLLILCVLSFTNAAKLPQTFERCQRKDPKLNECLKSAIQKAIIEMKPGVPSLHLLPLDPMEVSTISIQQGAGRPINVKLTLSNVKANGFSSVVIEKVRADLDNKIIQMEGNLPVSYMEGDYEMDGQFLVIPMKGKGKCRFDFNGLDAKIYMKAEESIKDGKSYWNIVQFDAKATNLEKFHVNFENLFNGDKALGDNTNKVLNENWKTFWEELRPSLEETFGSIFLQISKTIFSRVPENDIFLE